MQTTVHLIKREAIVGHWFSNGIERTTRSAKELLRIRQLKEQHKIMQT